MINSKTLRPLLIVMSICLPLLGSALSPTQERTISGFVADNLGEPLTGALVKAITADPKASAPAVIVDINGHFHLSLPADSRQFEVSFIGFAPQKVDLTSEDNYEIRLQPVASALDELVVTGYQTISKERAAGAFENVSAADLRGQRVADISTMLEGHVAGFSDGRLRGVTSMNGLSTPLYVIDGFPVEKTTFNGYNSFDELPPDINMDDIESITVLKDAAATSIYGARAANGVVVITTKKGTRGKTKVDFSATLTFQPYRTYTGHLADAETMVGLEREWAAQNPYLSGEGAADYALNLLSNNSGLSYYATQTPGIRSILQYHAGQISRDQMEASLAALSAQGYTYYKDVDKYGKKNPFYQQYNVGISHAGDSNNFYASFTYKHNQFADKYNRDESYGINLRNSLTLAKWVSVDVGAYINFANSTTQSYSLLSPEFTYMPYSSLVDASGNNVIYRQEDRYSESKLNTLSTYGLYNLDINPLEEIGMGLNRSKEFGARTYARLNFTITDWLKLSTQFQYEAQELRNDLLREKESYYMRNRVNQFAALDADGNVTFGIPYGNMLNYSTNSNRNYNFRTQLDFNRTFAEKHDVTALAGMELRENKLDYESSCLYGYDPDQLTYQLIDQAKLSTQSGLWGWASFGQSDVFQKTQLLNRFISFYANAAYAFDFKYLLNASIRWDRTNLFGTSSKYQNHPTWSVGAGWRINEENFMHGIEWVNNLKLRASYGVGGNIAKDSAPYMTVYTNNNTHVNAPVSIISSRPNPNLRWEKTTTFNVGIDFALLDNRISGAIDFYDKEGSDLLANTMGVPTEGWGYSTYTINNGKMRNRGLELTLNAVPVRSSDWTWNIGTNMAFNHNKVTYVNVEAPVLYLVFDYPEAYPRIGNPYNAIYAYQWAGLDSNGLPQVYDQQGNVYSTSEPSEIEDAVYAGTTVPKYSGSLTSSLRWKDWELSVMFLFETGHKMRNTLATYIDYYNPWTIPSADIANRWQQPADELTTDVPRFTPTSSEYYNYYSGSLYSHSTACVLDASNFRFRSLSLAYNFPASKVAKLGLKGGRLMVGMENIFMIAGSKTAKYLLNGYDRPNYTFSLSLNF